MFANKVFSAVRRSVACIGLAVAGFLALVSPAPANALVGSYCQTYGGGQGWSFSVVDNLDVTLDGYPDYYISFFHYSLGYIDAKLIHSRTVKNADGTITFWGSGTYNRRPATIKAVLKPTGGVYGQGIVYFYAYDDVNRNGFADTNEGLLTSAIRVSSKYTKLSY